MTMVWDEPKRQTNMRDHGGLDFEAARDRFEWETALVVETYAGKNGPRFMAVGFLDNDLVTLIFSPLGTEAISAISLRPASRRERKRYEQR